MWLSLLITRRNAFSFGDVGETAQGNKSCKLIKLLRLKAQQAGDTGWAGNRSDYHSSSPGSQRAWLIIKLLVEVLKYPLELNFLFSPLFFFFLLPLAEGLSQDLMAF